MINNNPNAPDVRSSDIIQALQHFHEHDRVDASIVARCVDDLRAMGRPAIAYHSRSIRFPVREPVRLEYTPDELGAELRRPMRTIDRQVIYALSIGEKMPVARSFDVTIGAPDLFGTWHYLKLWAIFGFEEFPSLKGIPGLEDVSLFAARQWDNTFPDYYAIELGKAQSKGDFRRVALLGLELMAEENRQHMQDLMDGPYANLGMIARLYAQRAQ